MIDSSSQHPVTRTKNAQASQSAAENHLQGNSTFDLSSFQFMSINPARAKALVDTDYCLVSYPRSGNTWTRLLICHALLMHKGMLTEPGKLPFPANEIIPDLHTRPVEKTWTLKNDFSFRIFKSHDLTSVSKQPLIYIFRNPIDALVSYYFYHQREPALRMKIGSSCDKFCLNKMVEYRMHLQAAISIKERAPERVMFLSYEHIHQHTFSALKFLFDFLRVSLPTSVLNQAIEHCQFVHYHKNDPLKEGSKVKFIRQGKVGKGKDQLLPETVAFIQQELDPYYQKATTFISQVIG